MKKNILTEEERRVIENKGTEASFSGEYNDFSGLGVYVCRACGAPLYRSEDKFNSGCGWPSFDSEVLGAVRKTLDEDGVRTEISCRRCGGHLGHVFEAENYTAKNVRHCVNSISLRFIPKENFLGQEKAYFGGGCFWCVEASFSMFKGVVSVTSGFSGGSKEDSNYKEVSSGNTDHIEVVEIVFDPSVISYELLLEVFFASHNPTTLNKQGADVGRQYRSVIFFVDEIQRELSLNFIKKLESEKYFDKPIVTEVLKFDKFYKAEEYHQDYFNKNKEAPYCEVVISPKMDKLREKFKNFLK